MKSHIGMAAALLAAVVALPLAAQDAPTQEEQAAISLALKRGEALYRYDQAAWHGTDAMLKAVKDPRKAGVAGWIVNEVEGGHEVVFYRPAQDSFEAVWSGVYDGKKVRQKTEYAAGQRILTDMEVRMIGARGLPSGAEMQRCSAKPFNSVVMPTGKGDGSLFVYYLVPQEKMEVVPFGGHYRYEVKDGKVVDSRKFTNSCIALSNRGPDGSKPVATAISHALDKTPTEIHVFSMYALRIPVAVIMTQTDKTWMIENSDNGPVMKIIALSSK